jgi:hypothetical protein
MASVTPPKRYALRSDCTTADSNPRISTHAPNTSTWGPNCVATIAPTIAPSAVPTNRCPDTLSAAPSDDCAITRVVIAAQYSSGNRNSRAASTEATAATAVRTECVRTSHHVHWTFLPAITFHLCWDAPKAGNTWSQRTSVPMRGIPHSNNVFTRFVLFPSFPSAFSWLSSPRFMGRGTRFCRFLGLLATRKSCPAGGATAASHVDFSCCST